MQRDVHDQERLPHEDRAAQAARVSRVSLMRPRLLLAASLLIGCAGWRLAESGAHLLDEWGAFSLRERMDLLRGGFDARARRTLERDHALHLALRRHVPHDALLVLFTAVGEQPIAARHRMEQLRHRLLSLLYPLDVRVCFGDVPGAEAYLATLSERTFLANVTPSEAFPLERAFVPVERGDGFSLWRLRSTR